MGNAEGALSIEGLAKNFGGKQVLEGVDICVRSGEVLGIIGPNGAGKTTLFNLITGFVRPDAGSIQFKGKDLIGLRPDQIARLGVGRTFQVSQAIEEMTVLEAVVLGAFSRRGSRAAANAVARSVLERVSMSDVEQVVAAELTTAQRHRLDLARTLAMGPEIILLDEITAGMWPEEQASMAHLIREINKDVRTTFVIIEHKLSFLVSVIDRAVAISFGSIIAEGPPRSVLADPGVVESYLGADHESS